MRADGSRNVTVATHADYGYDGFDRRVLKTVNGVATATVYDGGNVWTDFDGSGAATARYLTGGRLDELVARWRPGEGTGWYLADHLGTVRDVTDAAGAVANHVEYDSFGQVVSETNPAAGDRFKFTGQDYDAESGLYWYWMRYYNPGVGLRAREDYLKVTASEANPYRYVWNNPLQSTDPFGLTAASEYNKKLAIANAQIARLRSAQAAGQGGPTVVRGLVSGKDHVVGSPAEGIIRVVRHN